MATHGHRARADLFAAVLLAALVLAGCVADDPEAVDTPTPQESTTTGDGAGTGAMASDGASTDAGTGTIDTASVPPFPADTLPDVGGGVSGTAVFVGIRVARQAGFDRVVWEFAGDGVPGWRVAYTDDPRRDGSGDPVELPGDATLAVVLDGVTIPFGDEIPDGVVPYDGPATVTSTTTENITEVLAGAWFEGYQDPFVGVVDERPFRVFSLTDPSRIVMDVRDE